MWLYYAQLKYVQPYLLLLFVCFLVTSDWMQQLKFNVHYAHSKLKSVPMGQIILPRNILKKALGLLQVDFFFWHEKWLILQKIFIEQ